MSVTREGCGCRHDGHAWLSMCEPCAAEFQERHVRAQAEKDDRDADKAIEDLL